MSWPVWLDNMSKHIDVKQFLTGQLKSILNYLYTSNVPNMIRSNLGDFKH